MIEPSHTNRPNDRYHEISDAGVLVKAPLISVRMITYNHERFISQAIESIVSQKTDYPFELIIGEDCSTDRTREITLAYQKKYPEIIRVLAWKKNAGMQENGRQTIRMCRGKYMAICEGDDYFHHPEKLQLQVDFLKAHPDYGLVHSDLDHYYQQQQKTIHTFNKVSGLNVPTGDIYEHQMMPENYFIKTPTVCLLTGLYDDYYAFIGDNYRSWKMGDLPFWLYIAAHKKIGYIDSSLATYRVLEESTCHMNNPLKRIEFTLSLYDVRFFYMKHFPVSPDTEKDITKRC
jgi:glycosyltransferase involved in cell wall biosynthesis